MLVSLEGCGVKYVSGEISPNFQDYSIKKIAVLPFQTQPNPPDAKILEVRQVAEGSENLLTQLFAEGLQATGRYQIILQGQAEAALKTAQAGESETITPRVVQKTGKAVGADVVIIGRVQKFIERVGGRLGIESPASVGFVVTMISVGDGQTLWSSEYYETQKTLSEDINTLPLFIKRGGKWLTARELAEYGVEKMIETLPKKKR
jgi:hypothetical protein